MHCPLNISLHCNWPSLSVASTCTTRHHDTKCNENVPAPLDRAQSDLVDWMKWESNQLSNRFENVEVLTKFRGILLQLYTLSSVVHSCKLHNIRNTIDSIIFSVKLLRSYPIQSCPLFPVVAEESIAPYTTQKKNEQCRSMKSHKSQLISISKNCSNIEQLNSLSNKDPTD